MAPAPRGKGRGVWAGASPPQQRPARSGRRRLLVCSVRGEPRARSLAQVCSKPWKRFPGALHPPAPLPPLSHRDTNEHGQFVPGQNFFGSLLGIYGETDPACPGCLWAAGIQRWQEMSQLIPPLPDPATGLAKMVIISSPTGAKSNLKKKKEACMCVGGESTAESLNGGRAQMLLPRQPDAGAAAGSPGKASWELEHAWPRGSG